MKFDIYNKDGKKHKITLLKKCFFKSFMAFSLPLLTSSGKIHPSIITHSKALPSHLDGRNVSILPQWEACIAWHQSLWVTQPSEVWHKPFRERRINNWICYGLLSFNFFYGWQELSWLEKHMERTGIANQALSISFSCTINVFFVVGGGFFLFVSFKSISNALL